MKPTREDHALHRSFGYKNEPLPLKPNNSSCKFTAKLNKGFSICSCMTTVIFIAQVRSSVRSFWRAHLYQEELEIMINYF